MTKLLQKAFDELLKLPDPEQEAMAALVLEELASERRWGEAFAKSQDQLARMADEALKEFQEGKTLPWEPNSDLSHD